MISKSTVQKLLGKKGKKMNDQEQIDLLNQLYCLADIVTDLAISKGSKKQLGVIDSKKAKDQNER